MTITEFLLARIAEDEARVAVWEAGGALWPHQEHDAGECDECDHRRSHRAADDVLQDRVLAECEAKRRIVKREGERLREEWRRRSDEHRQTFEEWFQPPYGPTLRDLASVYADHPDFREEWRS